MRRLYSIASLLIVALAGPALADDDMGVVTTTTAEEGPGKIEAGIFLGSFINNRAHQFYDPDMEATRPIMDRFSPEFGGRFAVFPNRNFGVEAEASVILGSTDPEDGSPSDGAQIYGLLAQGMVQKPGKFTPYFALGIGMRHVSSDSNVLGSDTDFPIHASAGGRLFLSKVVALRFDLRYMRGPSWPHPDYTLNAGYGEVSLGVSFNPGANTEEAPPPPVEDPDPDKDGIIGAADACPNEAGAASPDGCPIRDKDGDGLVDKDDKCVDQAETVNKWEDTDGCPDTIPDSDADGLDDLADKCKDQAEDKDAFQDDDGCPDPDNDNDGVLDAKDKCPGTQGPIENNGCPDTDGDGDGIVDRLDNCPEEKGTEKNRGCKTKQLVVITKNQLQILDQVKFVTGSAKLSPASNKLLDNIARVLLAHPEIWKVKVEGHTDNVGKPEKNLTLSQNRAGSVVAYLVRKGVAPERLESVGHGDTKPIEDNTSKKGRAQNRRVEFNIVTDQ